MKVVHLDCDRDGKDSIASLVAGGYIDSYKCPTYKDAEGVIEGLKAGRIAGEAVIFDTVNGLTSTLNQELVYGDVTHAWDSRKKYQANWDTYRDTQNWTNKLNHVGLNLAARGVPIIFIAHERNTGERKELSDPLSGGLGDDRYTTNLQKGINEFLNAFCTAIVRLTYSTMPFEYESVAYPRGTRVLALGASRDSSVGTRVDSDWLVPNNPAPRAPIPQLMPVHERDPYAFYRFCQLLGRVPASTLLYGAPKVGKTTFAAGLVHVPKGS